MLWFLYRIFGQKFVKENISFYSERAHISYAHRDTFCHGKNLRALSLNFCIIIFLKIEKKGHGTVKKGTAQHHASLV